MEDKCFYCGEPLKKEKCDTCGYEFSIDIKCPRLEGLKCLHNFKICKEKNWEFCTILRDND